MSNKYLNNVIGNDNVEIKLNTSNIYYENKNVGTQKIKYSNLTKPHLFSIEGEMDKYYKLDIDSIPSIEGNINKREMDIIFNNVSKVFDGTNSTLNLYDNFKHNNGYYFIDNNMNRIGNFVNTLSETIYNSELLESSGNKLKNTYKLKYNITNNKDIKVILDDYVGYVLIDESNNIGEVIFNNNLLDKYKFIVSIKDNELNLVNHDLLDDYKVKKELIIHYYTEHGNTNIEHIKGDLGEGEFIINSSAFSSPEASNNLIPINITGELKDVWDNNYEIKNTIAFGKITERPINIDFVLKNKIYDGTNLCEIEDIPTITNYISNYVPTLNYNTKAFSFDSADVGNHKINMNSLNLYLLDNANNYSIERIIFTQKRTISKRDVKIKFTKLIYNTNKQTLNLYYEFENDIKTDNLTIDPNFKIVDKDGRDIISTYFNYKDVSLTDEISSAYKINKTNIDDDNRKANIDKQNNYDVNIDIGYSNNIKNNPNEFYNEIHSEESITKDIIPTNDLIYVHKPYDLSRGKPNYYEIRIKPVYDVFNNSISFKAEEIGFNSQDMTKQLKNKDIVTIKNIKLNPNNNKSKNYNLINSDDNTTHRITIEII